MTPFKTPLIFLALSFVLMFRPDAHAFGNGDKTNYLVQFLLAFPQAPVNGLDLSEPQALAIDAEGQLFVLDTGNSRLLKFDAQGNYQQSVGSFGWEREEFDRPLDITAKSGLDLFIADYNNERIERYDRNLNYISSLAGDPNQRLGFAFPTSVDISRHGELFICDSDHDRILKLNVSGEPDISFGDFNWGDGQLQDPVKIEITLSDLVYVSDRGADQIVVFDYYGNYVLRFGQGQLSNPNGLSWSRTGKLFVADSGNHRIAVYDRNHTFVYEWGKQGGGFGAFNNPVDVATFHDKIYVLDSANNRIQVFKMTEK